MVQKVLEIAEEFRTPVVSTMELILKKFNHGFAHQKGAIFGFGDQKYNDTHSILKISDLNQESLNKLNKHQFII